MERYRVVLLNAIPKTTLSDNVACAGVATRAVAEFRITVEETRITE